MANEWADGFNGYNTAADGIAAGWLNAGATATATPRFAGGRYMVVSGAFLPNRNVTAHATYTVGAAIYINNYNQILIEMRDGTTNQCELRVNAVGQLYVTRNGTTLNSVGTTTYPINAWYYIEFQLTVAPSTGGAYRVRVGETDVFNFTGQNTRNTANSQVTNIRFGFGGSLLLDDTYANSGAGTVDTGFWGDIRIDRCAPTADGATTGWTPSTGATVAPLVDEETPDDTDYGYTATLNAVHLWDVDNVSAGATTIYAIISRLRVLKDDAGPHTIAHAIRSGGTTYINATNVTVTDTAAYSEARYATDPATGAAWTLSGANAAQQGVNLTA